MKKALFIVALIVIIYLLARANRPAGPNRSKYGFVTDSLPVNTNTNQVTGVEALPVIPLNNWEPVI